jgi:starch synthase
LGSGGSHEINHLFSTLPINAKTYFKQLIYDEELSHQVYAAADLFVMPSLFEPCGLAQLISLRYGTLPLVRATGGLKETIFQEKNGFLFEEPTKEALNGCIKHALNFYRTPYWYKMRQQAMEENHGWERSIQGYLALYKKITSLPHSTRAESHIHG